MIKRISLISIALFFLSNSWVTAEETQVPPVIVGVSSALGFGLWKVYNAGEAIYFIDPDGERYLRVEEPGLGNSLDFDFASSALNKQVFQLENDGTSDLLLENLADSATKTASDGLGVNISGNLADGRYSFGDRRFVVSGETVTIFDIENEDISGGIVPRTVLNKTSNGLVHTGTTASSPYEATVILGPDNAPGPALIQGDCLATYSAETGHVEIPCLKILGSEAIYRVGQEQIPDTLNFSVDPDDVKRVQ